MTWGVPLSVSYHFDFSYFSWGSQGKNTEVVCHSLLQWTTFCQTSPPWPAHLGLPRQHACPCSRPSPQETLNTVLSQSLWWLWVLVYISYVWALWASLTGIWFDFKCYFAHPTSLLGLLLCPWMWGISSKSLQRHTAAALSTCWGLCPWIWDISSQMLQHCVATTAAQCIQLPHPPPTLVVTRKILIINVDCFLFVARILLSVASSLWNCLSFFWVYFLSVSGSWKDGIFFTLLG